MTSIQLLLKKFARSASMKRYRVFINEEKKQGIEYEYQIKLKDEMNGVELADALKKLEDLKEVRLSFDDVYVSQD